jgi:hypothetical protein
MTKMPTRSNKSHRGRPPLPPGERKRTLPVMFDPDQLDEIEAIASAEETTKGAVIRELISEALARRQASRQRRRQ